MAALRRFCFLRYLHSSKREPGHEAALQAGAFERPTPLVLLTAPFASSFGWPLAARSVFAQQGYTNITVDISTPSSATLKEEAVVDNLVDNIAKLLRQEPFPPILIAHGFAGLLAQKYLESYPSSGVVFVNAWTVHTVADVLEQWPNRFPEGWKLAVTLDNLQCMMLDSRFVETVVSKDKLVASSVHSFHGERVSLKLLTDILKNPPRFDKDTHIPVLVTATQHDPIVSQKDTALTVEAYVSSDDDTSFSQEYDCLNLSGNHFPMLDPLTSQAHLSIITTWLDQRGF